MSYMHILHILCFALRNTFPTSDWKEGFHWVVTKVLTLMNCFLWHNYGKGIYEKSLLRLMLGQYPQTGYEYLHFFKFHLSATSCHLMPYTNPRNNVIWAFGRCTCISSLNHADIIASVSYGSCTPTSMWLNETYNLSFLCGWTATTNYCWTATS